MVIFHGKMLVHQRVLPNHATFFGAIFPFQTIELLRCHQCPKPDTPAQSWAHGKFTRAAHLYQIFAEPGVKRPLHHCHCGNLRSSRSKVTNKIQSLQQLPEKKNIRNATCHICHTQTGVLRFNPVPKSTDFTTDFEQRDCHPQSFATCCAHKSDGKSSAKEHGNSPWAARNESQKALAPSTVRGLFLKSPRLINIVFFFGHFHMFP